MCAELWGLVRTDHLQSVAPLNLTLHYNLTLLTLQRAAMRWFWQRTACVWVTNKKNKKLLHIVLKSRSCVTRSLRDAGADGSGRWIHTAVSSPKCNSEERRTLFKWHRYLKIHIIRKINMVWTGIPSIYNWRILQLKQLFYSIFLIRLTFNYYYSMILSLHI